MPSPAEVWEEATAEAAAGSPSETKGKRNGEGILGVIWRALFGGRGEDYEKRLQYLSKEEAAVHARMRRRAQFARRGVRNLVVLSILSEVGAAVYAIVMTKSEDLGWRMRAFSVLPAFSVLLKTSMSLVGVDQKDQQALERLREERKAKIDELKVRTNYLTQKLIQKYLRYQFFPCATLKCDHLEHVHKYDLDPAAKAAAASVLATKLGAATDFKVYVGDEPKSESAPFNELRNRKQSKEKCCRTGNVVDAHNAGQVVSSETVGNRLETMEPSKVVGHYQSSGLARKEDFPHVTYYCPHCHALNISNQSIGRCSSSNSGQLTSSAQDGVSATNPVAENELGNLTKRQERAEEENSVKQPMDAELQIEPLTR
uniref:Lunapark domain-containing protein n=1 Tax=Leersia perrieri TaxID=77586 RepID=A0A0D9W7A0_9ORYZ